MTTHSYQYSYDEETIDLPLYFELVIYLDRMTNHLTHVGGTINLIRYNREDLVTQQQELLVTAVIFQEMFPFLVSISLNCNHFNYDLFNQNLLKLCICWCQYGSLKSWIILFDYLNNRMIRYHLFSCLIYTISFLYIYSK